MKKAKLIVILSVVAVLTVSFTIYAAAADTATAKNIRSFFGVDTSKLSDQQKSDLNSSIDKMTELQKDTAQKMADLQKEAVNKMVANGSMTKEQGDAAILRIDEELQRAQQRGFDKGFGMGKKGFGGSGKNLIDVSKLTDAQKADLKDAFTKMTDLQNETVNKIVSNGTLTKEQGDSIIKRTDEMVQKLQNNEYTKCIGIIGGGFGFFRIGGFDYSKLTEQQKSDLKDAYVKIAQLQKDTVTKMVINGAMTQNQADAANKRIDNELNNFITNGFPMNPGMNKGGMGHHGKGDSLKDSTSQTAAQ